MVKDTANTVELAGAMQIPTINVIAGTLQVAGTGNVSIVGGTYVKGGTLQVDGTLDSDVVVSDPAVLNTSGGSTVNGSIENDSTITSTIQGAVNDNVYNGQADNAGLTVTAGTTVVTEANGLADGSNLYVGSGLGTFNTVDPGQFVGGHYGDGDSDGGGGGSGGSSGPVLDNGMNEVQEIEKSGNDALAAIATVVYPGQTFTSLSTSQTLNLCSSELTIVVDAIADNGGTRTGMTTTDINAAIVSWLTTQGLTATSSGATFTSAYDNPWNNPGIAFNVAISAFFATNDVAPTPDPCQNRQIELSLPSWQSAPTAKGKRLPNRAA